MAPALKQEVRRFSSQHLDGSLMYPGDWLLTYIRIASVWFLIEMVPFRGRNTQR